MSKTSLNNQTLEEILDAYKISISVSHHILYRSDEEKEQMRLNADKLLAKKMESLITRECEKARIDERIAEKQEWLDWLKTQLSKDGK